MKPFWMLTIGALLATASGVRADYTATRPTLTLGGARQVIAATAAEAQRLGSPGGAIAVVDDGGNLIALERLDQTFPAAAGVAIGKARTASLFRKPTKFFEDVVNNGRTTMVALPDFTPLQGGVPITVDGQIVGAVGVSGAASAQQDHDLAVVGAAALGSGGAHAAAAGGSDGQVTFFDHDHVADAFSHGMPLLETPLYKVHASRRVMPGQAEVHTDETDVVYVLEGEATLVTGGTVIEGKTTAPGELRGAAIDGGESRRLVKGDVIVIPPGVPHWFKEVTGPFLYFVVKPISQHGTVAMGGAQ